MYAGGNLNRHFFGGLLHFGTVHPLRAGRWESFRSVIFRSANGSTRKHEDVPRGPAFAGAAADQRLASDAATVAAS
jgi:hypothetical protein